MNTPIHIIYASTSGNTEFVMDTVANKWRKMGREVVLHRSEATDIGTIKENSHFLLATSTWDHGAINPFFNKLLAEMKKTDCFGKQATFIGLGDRKYSKHHFCKGMTTLKEVWEKSRGESLGVALTIGREPFDELMIKVIEDWAEKTLELYEF